jgi:hypothetical protein
MSEYTPEALTKLAFRDPVIRHIYQCWQAGQLSFEQACIAMVIEQTKRLDACTVKLVEHNPLPLNFPTVDWKTAPPPTSLSDRTFRK